MSDKIVYTVPDDIRKQDVTSLQVKPEVIAYLQSHGYKTIEDVIAGQKKIPKKYIVPIKAKLMFNLDL